MNRRTVWSLALAILVTAFVAHDASARTFVPTPNLSGTWRLERRWNHRNHVYGRAGSPGMAAIQDIALPRSMQIDQGRNRIRVTNRQGQVVQVVLLDDHFGFNARDRFGARNGYRNDRDVLIGQWHGPVLEAEQMGPRGGQVKQTFRLANRGRTLIVRTEVARGRSGATLQIEQVFERA